MDAQQWIRIDQLFHSALTHEPAERAAFLSEACAGDDSLRSEVEALLAADGQLGSFLEHVPENAAMTLEPGLSVGAYQIVELIARGGMGEVYRARDTRLAREVALKVLPRLASAPPSPVSDDKPEALGKAEALKSPGAMPQRFEAEALLTANVQHPAVVPIYERGQLSDGRPFYAMKLVSGRSLRQLIDQHTTIAARMALLPNVIVVAEALAHAHGQHILHRDVKPSNIIIGEFSETVLIDWGVAKHIASGSGESPVGGLSPSPERTAQGVIIGTPAYMSPEQAQGKPVDERADVFSLGATLYHLISGRAPYEGDTAAILPRVVRGDYAPLSVGELGVPTELAAIVNKAMEREPSRRYPTARELAEDLRRFQTGQLVLSHRYSARELVVRWARRHRALLLASAVFLLLAMAGAMIGLRRIVAERDRANREAAASNRVSQFMTEMFKVSDPSEARGNNVTAREILDKASKDVDTGLAKDPAVQSRLMDTMAQVYQSLGLSAKARPLAEKAAEVRHKLLGPEHPDTLRSRNLLANIERELWHFATAETLHLKLVEIQRRRRGPEHPDTLASMNELAFTERTLGKFAEAAELHRQVLETRRRVLGPEHPDTLASMNNLAVAKDKLGQFADAEKILRELVEIRRRTLGPDHPNTLRSLFVLANLEREQGHYAEAAAFHEQILAARRRILGPDHQETLRTMASLAEDKRALGEYAEAESIYRQTLDSQRRVLGPEHGDQLAPMVGLGSLYLAMKRFADAETMRRKVLDLSTRWLGAESPNTLSAMNDLAEVESALGRQGEAERLCRTALDIQRRTLGPEHLHTLGTMRNLANIYARQARYEESEKLQKEALAISQRLLGSSHPRVAPSFWGLGRLALRQGDRKKALDYLRQAIDHGLSPVDLTRMHEDDELAPLRGDPAFEALVKQLTNVPAARSTRPTGSGR